jgi:chemotaxis protein CheZ
MPRTAPWTWSSNASPLAERIAREAERLIAAQDADGSSPALQPHISAFLRQTGTSMAAVRSNLSEVLLTQGYQDLSGQIIRGVMTLVDELEEALRDLLCIADPGSERDARAGGADAGRGFGPRVPGVDQGPAVAGQQDVDALLSDLGI